MSYCGSCISPYLHVLIVPTLHRYLGKRLDEDHLYPDSYRKQIEAVVDMLLDSGVSASDLASFSQGLQILDSLTAACLCPQDWLGCLASQVYVKGTRLIFVMPPECKNSEALKKSEVGLVVTHAKSDRTKGECVLASFLVLVAKARLQLVPTRHL